MIFWTFGINDTVVCIKIKVLKSSVQICQVVEVISISVTDTCVRVCVCVCLYTYMYVHNVWTHGHFIHRNISGFSLILTVIWGWNFKIIYRNPSFIEYLWGFVLREQLIECGALDKCTTLLDICCFSMKMWEVAAQNKVHLMSQKANHWFESNCKLQSKLGCDCCYVNYLMFKYKLSMCNTITLVGCPQQTWVLGPLILKAWFLTV